MSIRWWRGLASGLVLAALLVGALAAGAGAAPKAHTVSFSTYVSGLLNPRGMTFGPDGSLYVAEGGSGGTNSTAGNADTSPQSDTPPCRQVPGPSNGHPTGPGPTTGGFTARISRIDQQGVRHTVVDGLPSAGTPPAGAIGGVADVKFLGGRLYAITAGAGCSHGLAGTHNAVLEVTQGATREVVDLSAYLRANPVADTTFETQDYEPDGTWYSMVRLHGAFYATEPNHQEVDRIEPNGHVSRVLDMSQESLALGRWIGPTAITTHDGDLYFGTLAPFPITPGQAAVYRLTPRGELSLVADDLTTVLGVAFDCSGRLYALESMNDTNPPFPTPNQAGTGRVVRIDRDGRRTTVVDGLSFPSAMTFGPDGLLYISNFGFSSPTGEIVRADVGGGRCGGNDDDQGNEDN
jgi:hypothetical protein